MNFIKERALLEKRIDELIKSREEVFNETLQDMLQAAIANYTGKDNSDGPTLPKTPSTCRRLRSRQQRKRKQQNDRSQNDGSPQLSRMLRSNANKQKDSDTTTNEAVSTPLHNISNKMDCTDQTIDTVRRSNRQCAIKATHAITQQTGRKKGSSNSRKCSDRVSDGTAPQLPSASFGEEDKLMQPQGSSPLLQQNDTLPSYHNEHVDVDVPSLKKVSQGLLETNSVDHTITDDSLDVSVSPELHPVPFLRAHPLPSATTPMESESSCLNETRTISGPQEDSASDDDKFSTPPSDVNTGVIEESKPADGIRRVTTVIKKDAATEKANRVIVNNGPSVNLALLTKLTPPLDSTPDVIQTPATVMKDCFTKNYSTVIKGCPTSSHTVAETPVTITKVASNSNSGPNTDLTDEQNDGSPELAVIRKPQECPVGSSYTVSDATKKQITPTNNAFSPAKFKSTVPLEPSGLLYSNHAPPKAGLGSYKKLANKEEQMQKAKEKLAEKNRRDKERLQQLEKKKEQERLEKKRRNQEQLRKVQERQALMLKKKEVQKMQVQQKLAATDSVSVEEVKTTKVTEKPHYEMPKYNDQGMKLKDFYSATCESDEEHYWEEEKRKRDNCKDYKYHIQKEMEEANLEKKRMCSVDKFPAISSDEGYTSTAAGLTSLYSNSCMDDDDGDYGLDDLNSDDSTDEEDDPRKPIPQWAQDDKLLACIRRQEERPLDSSMAIFSGEANPVNLGRIFKTKKQRFFKRTSSAQWSSPPTKANNNDWIV